MKRIFMMKIAVIMLLVFGWFHYIPGAGAKVVNGYTYKMVENTLGYPEKIEHLDKVTKWVYTLNNGKKILFFENGKLVITYNREL